MNNNVLLLTKLFFRNSSSSSKDKNKLIFNILTAVFSFVALVAVVIYLWNGVNFLYPVLKLTKIDSLIVPMLLRGTTIVIYILSLISVFTYFYFSTDIESLLPLPIKASEIVVSKLIVTLVGQYVWTAIILLPTLIVYGMLASMGPIYYISALIVILTLPIVPVCFNVILCMIIMSFSKGSKNKDRFRVLSVVAIFFVFLAARYFTSKMHLNTASSNDISSMIVSMTNSVFFKITNVFYNVIPAEKALTGDMTASLINILILLVMVLVTLFVIVLIGKKLYLRGIVGSNTVSTKKKELTADTVNKKVMQSSELKATINKEIKNIFGSSVFMLNCVIKQVYFIVSLGMISGSGLLQLIKSGGLANASITDSALQETIATQILIIALAVALNPTASSSVSREGYNSFILKYLPVRYSTQLFAKAITGFIVNSVYILLAIVVCIVVRLNILLSLFTIGLIILVVLTSNLIGVIIDANRPKLNWTDESTPTRKNLNIWINGGINIVLVIGVLIVSSATPNPIISFGILIGMYAIIDLIAIVYIKKYSNKLLKKLVIK